MSVFYSNFGRSMQRFFAVLAIVTLVASALPTQAFAEEAGEVTPILGCTDIEANNYNSGATEDDGTCTYDPEPILGCVDESATNYDSTATEDDGACEYPEEDSTTTIEEGTGNDAGDGESTGDGTVGETASTTDDGSDGTDGDNYGADGETASTTASTTPESTASTTDDGTGDTGETGATGTLSEDGSGGDAGDGGDGGDSGDATEEEPVPVFIETEIGEDESPEDGEGVTGGVRQFGRNTTITTGKATAQGEVSTYVNSNHIRSEMDPGTTFIDLDIYTFNATGTNEAIVTTEGAAVAITGDNAALSSSGVSEVISGDAVATINIANVVNSNVINSDGFIYLKNQVLEESGALDLGDFFFPDEASTLALAEDCTLLSCMAEDVVYNFSQYSMATVTNDATIEAVSGENIAEGDYTQIETGDAFGGANVINVVNTNIIDSNYRLLTYNALGDLNGDLVLPTQELFNAFFGRPNGITQLETAEDIHVTVENVNEALVENNLDTYAETGLNESTTVFDTQIQTGNGEAESNIVNKINKNIYGGDSMYLLIRVHGYWSGDVLGLPDGLSWEWTPEGILIYNTGAEIAPSKLLPYDVDSYSANFTNHNDVVLKNNITIAAVTGKNSVDGLVGNIETGDAFASANIMNIANTNIIGVNWTMAVINIFGDFDGNVTFAKTDLELSGVVESTDTPVIPGSPLMYTYTITNTSDVTATGVVLKQTLQLAHATGTVNQQEVLVGTLAPGETREALLEAFVDSELDYGTSSVSAVATIDSNESDSDESNNAALLIIDVYRESGDTGGTGTTTDDGTASTTDDGTGTTTDDGTAGTTGGDTSGGSNSSGGGGGGGSKSSKADVSRFEEDVDSSSAPLITIKKTADIKEGRTILAGEVVNYDILVRNKGGTAYDAIVTDTLRNPIGVAITTQSWDLGIILPGENITLTYTTQYNSDTPSGTYTNTASILAYEHASTSRASTTKPLLIEDSVHLINIKGRAMAVGNVGVIKFLPTNNGKMTALISWETNTSANGQVFYGQKIVASTHNSSMRNYGYPRSSFRMPFKSIKHFAVLSNLTKGVEYTYHVRSSDGKNTTYGGQYSFVVPGVKPLAVYTPTPKVSGVAVALPKKVSYVAPRATAVPVPAETPEPTPEPVVKTPKAAPSGGFGGFVKKVFGFFR